MTNILIAPAAYAQDLIDIVHGDTVAALKLAKDAIDADGRWQGAIGTRQWAKDVIAVLEAAVALEDKEDSAGRFLDAEELEGLQVIRTRLDNGSTIERGLGNVSLGIAAVANGITRREALDRLKAGEELRSSAWSYRLVATKAPEALSVDELAAELTEERPGDLIDAQGGRWHVQVTAISHIRPDRALWVYRALANTSDVKPGVQGFYAASLRRAKIELGIEPEGPQGPKALPSSYDHRTPEGQAREAAAAKLFASTLVDYGQDLTREGPIVPQGDDQVDLDADFPGWREEPTIIVGANLITPQRAYAIVSTYVNPMIRSERRLGSRLNQIERQALVAYIGSDDDVLLNALIEALAELCPAEDRQDRLAAFRQLQIDHEAAVQARRDREELAKLQEGHKAFQRAQRRGWDAQDVAWRTQALKGLQDSRNAAQVAA